MVSAPDCGSGDRGFESHYPPFFYVKLQPFMGGQTLLGYRQAVKAQHFDCCIVGSIPTSPVHGTLAQMVEHLTFNQVVGGSSPPCLTFSYFLFPFFCGGTITLRRRILRVAMSHAHPRRKTDAESLLSSGRLSDWMHTANAATASERLAFASLSAWRIA